MLVTGYLTDSYQIKLDVEGFEYIVDRSIEKGGENTGTSPFGMLLSSIAGCKLMVARGYLEHNEIPFERLEIETDGNITGSSRRETVEISVKITVIGAELTEKEHNFMTRIVDRGCTMANILTAGGENKVDLEILVKDSPSTL